MSALAPQLILVDGSSFLFRAFHALPPLTNSRGEPTGAVYGVASMLRNLLATYPNAHFAMVFDASGPTFRDELYAQYKAHRPPMPDDLRVQIEPLHQLVRAWGVPLLLESGVEADDVIGTLARHAAADGVDVVIASSDKDLAQLVDGHVVLENTMSKTRMNHDGVMEKFGVRPDQMVDYLVLVGDSADNIPGVPGVGPKTAAKWLQQYGSLEQLIAHVDDIKGKVGEALRAALPQFELTRRLAVVHTNLPLAYGWSELVCGPPDTEQLRELFSRLEFKSWLEKLDSAPAPVDPKPIADHAEAHYETLLTAAAFERWLEKLRAAPLICLDTETTSLDYLSAEIVGIALAVEPYAAAYIPLSHRYPGAPQQLDTALVLAALQPLLEDPARAKLGQNLKYDAHVLANYGVQLRGIDQDTMLESYALNSTATRHDMDTLAQHYLGYHTIHYEDVAGKGAKQICFDQVEVDVAARYSAEDADVTFRLHQRLWPELAQAPGPAQVYREIELPLVPVLLDMERTGVLIDGAALRQHSHELALRIKALEDAAYQSAGTMFNLGSPKQLQEVLFTQLKLPVLRKTPTGQPSTDESVLEELAADGAELPRLILEHRTLSKLKSTYTDKLPKQIHPKTGRVHTSYQQAVAATGRLSSSDPNLQNIPVRSEEGRKIRAAFIAPPGHLLLSCDYSQIELRIMAHLSQDPGLLRAFAAGEDVHRATAAEVFGVAPEAVSSDMRRSAKAINFGLIYGMSAFGLARQLNVPREQAGVYMNLYFERYPGVKDYMERMRQLGREQGYVETIYGRRLYLPDINNRNGQRRQYAERTAINAPMQGSAADIIKRAMIAVHAWLARTQPPVKMILQVHDELVFEVAEDYADATEQQVKRLMSAAAELAVPLPADAGRGRNWGEAHE